jgi:general nucleoside transport system ATP-binding protein
MTGGEAGGEAIGCSHLWKAFGACVSNRDVSLSVARGEVHAVVGENGAGKSTLMRALYGLVPPDAGEVRIGGEVVAHPSPAESLARNVGMVHQHFMLVPTLTVAENAMLGHEPTRVGLLDRKRVARELGELAKRLGLEVDPARRVSSLSVGEQQRVEILKVLWRGADVLILDEPTAVLTPAEVTELFVVLQRLVADGKTVILVTHKLDEVMALAQRVTVMRRGQVVATLETRATSAAQLAQAMVGRELSPGPPRPLAVAADARERLIVEHLTVTRAGTRALDDVSLSVRAGEILGVAGVEGNGQSELALAVAGVLHPRAVVGVLQPRAARIHAGRILVDGVDVTRDGVRARHRRGVGHVPEDRLARGVVGEFSVAENVLLGRDDVYGRRLGGVDRKRLSADTRRIIERLDVRPAEPDASIAALSGGNQQKVVVGRELLRNLSVLVCAQPTRGVDVGAIERIHSELAHARTGGKAVLLISADLDELLALSDRIGVLYRGRVAGCVVNVAQTASERAALRHEIGAMMLGAGA